jgi:formylmethanofuran dehydrogenase subunit D
LEVSLLTGRTIDQGCGKEIGKLSQEYMEDVAVCEMNAKDMKKLGIRDNDKVKVTTEFGSVVVKAKKSRRLNAPYIVFIPYGPWANQVSASNTHGTGMPLLKGIKATVEPTDAEVLNVRELLLNTYEKTK